MHCLGAVSWRMAFCPLQTRSPCSNSGGLHLHAGNLLLCCGCAAESVQFQDEQSLGKSSGVMHASEGGLI